MRNPETGKAIITRSAQSNRTDRDILRLRSTGQSLEQIQTYLEKKRGVKLNYASVRLRYQRALKRLDGEFTELKGVLRVQQYDKLDFMWEKMASEYEEAEEVPLSLVDRMDRLIDRQNKILGLGNTPSMLEIKNTSGEADWRALMVKDIREISEQANWAENLLLPDSEQVSVAETPKGGEGDDDGDP